ncbi:hypothetical protein BGZ76_002801 [Entomortierella beljakovae]|nr:hypothetical protein BGZ76_002801 [Entomortierella beljakovae]
MKSFAEHVIEDTHDHKSFDKQLACFTQYVGRQRQRGNESAKQYSFNIEELRREYNKLLLQSTSEISRKSASTIVNTSIELYTSGKKGMTWANYDFILKGDHLFEHLFVLDTVQFIGDKASGQSCSSAPKITMQANTTSSSTELLNQQDRDTEEGKSEENTTSKRDTNSAEDHAIEHAHKEPRRVSFGRGLTLADLSTGQKLPSNNDDPPEGTHLPTYSPRSSLGSNLLSTDSGDQSFGTHEDPNQSTSKLYTWNFLDGEGRIDSTVHSHWVHNGTTIGAELMKFRIRTIQNNGGLTETHQKLAVNFIFLMEEEYRTDGLQAEVEDRTWDAMCDSVNDYVQPLSKEVASEALEWLQKMANNKMEVFEQMLEDSPPSDRNLKAVLRNVSNNSQYWNTQARNEDTYLKSMLGPLLDAYFGKLRHSKSDWTPTQDDTVDPEYSTLIPDYGTATLIGNRRYFVLLLEGKIARNTRSPQMWDDLSKLGNEMKLALDSILKLEPSGEVSVVGILVREPLVEFFSMQIRAEGTYVMNKFASTFIPSGATNAFPILRLMEVCDYAKKKMENCIHEIRKVKVQENTSPKVPLSWLRPSFNKPRRQQITD